MEKLKIEVSQNAVGWQKNIKNKKADENFIYHPANGAVVKMIETEVAEVEVGGQYFGSGGGWVVSSVIPPEDFEINEKSVEFDAERIEFDDNGFVSSVKFKVALPPGWAIYNSSGDDIGEEGRIFYRKLFYNPKNVK